MGQGWTYTASGARTGYIVCRNVQQYQATVSRGPAKGPSQVVVLNVAVCVVRQNARLLLIVSGFSEGEKARSQSCVLGFLEICRCPTRNSTMLRQKEISRSKS